MTKDLHYLTDHYDEKIKKIKEIGAPLNFVFVTDMHNNLISDVHGRFLREHPEKYRQYPGTGYDFLTNDIASIQYILDRCPEIRFVINGGDIGNDYAENPEAIRASYREVMDALYSLSVPVYSVVGNHDDALGNAMDRGVDTRAFGIPPQELHQLCMRDNPSEKNYYYIDVDGGERGYRFVFLDTSDKPYYLKEDGQYPFGWRNEVSLEQIDWFVNEALKTRRAVIVVSHTPLHNAGIFGTEAMPVGIKPYDDLLSGPRIYHFAKRAKNIVMFLAGHVHYDNLLYDDRILSVTSLCALAQEWAPCCPRREIGTVSETAFDVFSIKDNVVYITRFGAGEDRVGCLLNL